MTAPALEAAREIVNDAIAYVYHCTEHKADVTICSMCLTLSIAAALTAFGASELERGRDEATQAVKNYWDEEMFAGGSFWVDEALKRIRALRSGADQREKP